MEYKPIKEGATVYSGFAFKRTDLSPTGDYQIIKIGNLVGNTVDYSKTDYISKSLITNKHNKYFLNNKDVLIAMTGQGSVGRIAQLRKKEHDALLLNQRVGKFVCNETLDNDYLFYVLSSTYYQELLFNLGYGSGQPNLSPETILNVSIPFPDLNTQQRIASILSSIEDKIVINSAINENLEQQAQAYFIDLFVTNANPAWEMGTISDLGNVIGGGTPSKKVDEYYTDNGIAWITPKDLSNDKSKFVAHGETDITELGLAKSSATLMPKGTVLFSSRAPIGYIAIADGQVSTNQGFKSIVPFGNVGTEYIYYFLKENLSAIENVASGSTFKEVSGSTMKNFGAVIPDNDTLAEFQRFCTPLFEQQRALEYECRYLADLRDILLPKLMNGEIDVSAVQI